MGVKKRNRKHSKIDRLPPELRDTVEQMLLAGATYQDIVGYLGSSGVMISISSVCRYATDFHASAQQYRMAQDNFRMLMGEMEKYPDLDTTKALETLTSHKALVAVANMEDGKWADVAPDALVRQVNGLIRAAAYKRRTDVQNQADYEAGFEAAKQVAFSALAKERPELYKEVSAFLNQKKKESGE